MRPTAVSLEALISHGPISRQTGDRLFLLEPAMAKCDEGYLCAVCGADVERIADSDLYLRYVVGMIHPELLHVSAERHIRCHPALAQFIVDPEFAPVVVEGPMDKRKMDADFVRQREALVTRGYRRLREIELQRPSILEYPLPEVIEKWADGRPIHIKLPKEY